MQHDLGMSELIAALCSGSMQWLYATSRSEQAGIPVAVSIRKMLKLHSKLEHNQRRRAKLHERE